MNGEQASTVRPASTLVGDDAGPGRVLLLCLLLAGGYALGALAAFHATDVVSDGVKLFAPAGMTVAALVCTTPRRWPLLIGIVAATEIAIDIAHGYPMSLNAGFALANVSHPLVTASVLRRWGPAEPFATPAALLRFLAVLAATGPVATALIGAGTLGLAFGEEAFRRNIVHWYLGDAWGAVLVGTALLAVLSAPPLGPRWASGARPDPAGPLERNLWLVAVALATAGAYFTGLVVLQWTVLPLVLAVALRAGLRRTGLAVLTTTAIAELAVSTGHGLAGRLGRAEALDALQGYLGVTLVCGLLLAVEAMRRSRLQVALGLAEQERLEADLLRSRRFEAIGQRAAGLAHDFNNLLGVVRNYAEHIGRDPAATPRIRDDVGQISEAAARGGDLVQRLLAMVRDQSIEPAELDLAAMAADLVELVRVPFAPHTVEVVADGEVIVFGDRLELDRLLLNLLCNARDALAVSGRITVRVGRGAADGPQQLPAAVLEVCDDGAGMAPQVAARAFEPSFSTKAGATGRGWGLPSVRSIVEQHGGTVALSSRSGSGTTVTVRLPLVAGSSFDGDGSTAAVPAKPHDAALVLVVDDEIDDRRRAARLLHRLGYATVSLPDADAALDALRHGPRPDLVLSDVMMAGTDGLAFAHRMSTAAPDLPVVLMSAGADADRDELPWPLLRKPLDAADLADVLDAALAADAAPPR
ncbi:MAG: ATP-binding protein [Acidimicrobiia bacterium]